MHPYKLGNAFSQQRYLQEQRGSYDSLSQANSIFAANDNATFRRTILEAPTRQAGDISTPGTSMNALVGPVTETEAAGRRAVARQRAEMEDRLRPPTRPPPLRRRNTNTTNRSSQASTQDVENQSPAPDPSCLPFYDKFIPKGLRGRNLRIDIDRSNSINSRQRGLVNCDKPLPPGVPITIRENEILTIPNLLTLPAPPTSCPAAPTEMSSSPPIPPAASPTSIYSAYLPSPLNPTASPFRPGENWPLPNVPLLPPPKDPTSSTPPLEEYEVPETSTYQARVQLSPTPKPRNYISSSLHPSGMISSTQGIIMNGQLSGFITPARNGTYAEAGKPVFVQGVPRGISMKGSILEIGDLEIAELDTEGGVHNDHAESTQEAQNEAAETSTHAPTNGAPEPQPQSDASPTALIDRLTLIESHLATLTSTLATAHDLSWTLDSKLTHLHSVLLPRLTGLETCVQGLATSIHLLENRMATIEEKLDRWFTQVRYEEQFRGGRYPGQGGMAIDGLNRNRSTNGGKGTREGGMRARGI